MAISGPIAPYSNFPINAQYYQPSRFVISAVTLGLTTTVTTTQDVNFVVGQLVRLLIPNGYGCTQLNELTGYVISLPASNQVQMSIDSSKNVNAFTSSTNTTQPQIIAVGDVNNGTVSSNGLIPFSVPGAFINISPL